MTKLEIATFAGGCFWCTEAVFQRLRGVTKVTSGYCQGAESVQVEFNPNKISYEKLLDVFFGTHDATQLNRQGYDIGPQYRSAIFYHNDEQKKSAEIARDKIKGAVTEITQFTEFRQSEDFHKNYYNNNPNAVYCKLIIDPKIKKLYKNFKHITR